MHHAERERIERHERHLKWNRDALQAVRHLWNGDTDAGIEALEAIIQEMKAYQASQRGGTA